MDEPPPPAAAAELPRGAPMPVALSLASGPPAAATAPFAIPNDPIDRDNARCANPQAPTIDRERHAGIDRQVVNVEISALRVAGGGVLRERRHVGIRAPIVSVVSAGRRRQPIPRHDGQLDGAVGPISH